MLSPVPPDSRWCGPVRESAPGPSRTGRRRKAIESPWDQPGVQCPDRLLVSRPRAAAAQQSGYRTAECSVSRKSLAKAGCAWSARRGFERDFRIAGDLQSARPFPVVGSVTRRTSAFASGTTATSYRVSISPSRRRRTPRSGRSSAWYSSAQRPAGWRPADQTLPSSRSRM